jgi:hypothetical protein
MTATITYTDGRTLPAAGNGRVVPAVLAVTWN